MEPSAFETLLQQFAPDVYKLHMLGKVDAHLWEAIYTMLNANTTQMTGTIAIKYTKGHIEDIDQTTRLLAFKASRPGY